LKDEIPNLPQFLRLLKNTYEIETNELNPKPEKWKPLLGHFQGAKSVKIAKLKSRGRLNSDNSGKGTCLRLFQICMFFLLLIAFNIKIVIVLFCK